MALDIPPDTEPLTPEWLAPLQLVAAARAVCGGQAFTCGCRFDEDGAAADQDGSW